VQFLDSLSIIPANILDSYLQPDATWDTLLRTLPTSNQSTLEQSCLCLQQFLRRNLHYLRHYNEEKCRLVEELDNIETIKKGELERVKDYRTEMRREADIEMMENDRNHNSDGSLDNEQVEEEKKKVKRLEAENVQVKQECATWKEDNKRIALDTFSLYEHFTQIVADIKGMEIEKKRLENIQEKYIDCIGTMQYLLESIDAHTAEEIEARNRTISNIDTIIATTEDRYNKRKLTKRLMKLQQAAGAQNTGEIDLVDPMAMAS